MCGAHATIETRVRVGWALRRVRARAVRIPTVEEFDDLHALGGEACAQLLHSGRELMFLACHQLLRHKGPHAVQREVSVSHKKPTRLSLTASLDPIGAHRGSLGLIGAHWGSLGLVGAHWGSLGLIGTHSGARWGSLHGGGSLGLVGAYWDSFWGSLGMGGAHWGSLASIDPWLATCSSARSAPGSSTRAIAACICRQAPHTPPSQTNGQSDFRQGR